MHIFPEKKRRVWPIILGIILFLGAVAVGSGYWFWWRTILKGPVLVAQNSITSSTAPVALPNFFDLLPEVLGFDEPHTYLLLFQNNTELRPGGGFIGSYAVLTMTTGGVTESKVEGTEILDRAAPAEWRVVPPAPMKKYLSIDRWQFRDSNWSPDYVANVQKAMAFYQGEKGYLANDIDTVIAVTPTVLEELLRLTGPVTIDGKTFTADNVTETLEYQVEIGYRYQGIAVKDRKQIMEPFFHTLMSRVRNDALFHSASYVTLMQRLMAEKHILAYSRRPALAEYIAHAGAEGRVIETNSDYLLWVDANLAALKTDHAMVRGLTYEIDPVAAGQWEGVASMTYIHEGGFDWRTTRYRTYARVYVPAGATLVSAQVVGKNKTVLPVNQIDKGEELGKQWFGTFISIEPKEVKTVVIRYRLPATVAEQIKKGDYGLIIQKQAGTIAHQLTLNLDFGTTITSATPGEASDKWHDTRYELNTDLRLDRQFSVNLK